MPVEVQPDIKNLKLMSDVWKDLDEETGQVMELTSELIEALTSFHISKEAKTEDAKFAELYRIWTQMLADLSEVGKISALDHEPTLAKFARRLPNHASRTKYVDLRLELLQETPPKTELQIISLFLLQQRKRQKCLGGLEGKLAGGCALCLDWTGDHTQDKCVYKSRGKAFGNCLITTCCVPCGDKHKSLLHGTNSKYCNLAQVHTSIVPLGRSPPTMDEVERTENPCALIQVQWLECVGNVNQALAFWDTGSNVNLVRKPFAKMAGWMGLPFIQQLQTTG